MADDALNEVVVVGYGTQKKSLVTGSVVKDKKEENAKQESAQVRENLSETAFFYPALETDASGRVALKFTLPESVTTWRFIGLAHDKDLNHGMLEGEAVAKKDVMVMPNMPRFVREGDEATVTARIANTSKQEVKGTARLQLLDPETEKVVYEQKLPFAVKPDKTSTVAFNVATGKFATGNGQSLYICRIVAEGAKFSDGEQHYLPVLPNMELVTNTYPFTQNKPGTKEIAVSALIPSSVTKSQQARLTAPTLWVCRASSCQPPAPGFRPRFRGRAFPFSVTALCSMQLCLPG